MLILDTYDLVSYSGDCLKEDVYIHSRSKTQGIMESQLGTKAQFDGS
jgi:hypothetical protein